MVLGPLFRREYRAALRQRRSFRARVLSALLLVAIAGTTGYLALYRFPLAGQTPDERVARAGRAMFLATLVAQSTLLIFFVPAIVGPAIAEERQRDTLDILLLTRLRPIELAAVKAVARWLPVLQLLLGGLPVILLTALLAGLPREAALTMAVLASTSLFLALLAILASGRKVAVAGAAGATPGGPGGGLTFGGAGTAKNSAVSNAQAMAFLLGLGWLAFPPVMAAVPIRTGELWGDLFYEVQRACIPIAPSSPLSLLTSPGWLKAPGTSLDLESRVALMIGLQAALALPVLLLAATQLRPREDRPNWADPTLGHRPPVGDDPIFWREYELPSRRGAGSLGVMIRRLFLILLRTLFLSLVTLVGVYLIVVIPLGLGLAFLSFGLGAAREAWEQGYSFRPGISYTDRESFNIVVRAATGVTGLLPALLVGAAAGSRITAERDKKAWEIFLTTPLDSRAILRSKVRATLESLRPSSRLLVVAWAAGLLLGVVHPLGVLLAAADLALMVAACVAVSLNLALRPGATRDTATQGAAWTLALFAAHFAAVGLMLVSPLDRQELAAWPPWGRLGLVAIVALVPSGTALVAWAFGRQLLARFDEWVGRPLRPGPAADPFAVAAGGPDDPAERLPVREMEAAPGRSGLAAGPAGEA